MRIFYKIFNNENQKFEIRTSQKTKLETSAIAWIVKQREGNGIVKNHCYRDNWS